MTDRHTLGATCRPRGVDDIGGVVRAQRAETFGVGDRRAAGIRGAEVVERDGPARITRKPLTQRTVRHHEDRIGVGEYVFEPVGGVGDIQRQVPGARFQHRQRGDDQIGVPWHRHGHQ
ncbi:hypothetical protein GCM10011588_62750 [Nocardia jinanensis]|uniref:Uncharacterized protein n=1 Tax=Nocardia jinanensis TaxID=382504 RepID=A0A917RVH5_9NOCA|nr:hypothetical protein GCM10011588_62750 [Nocardia jinanensis]